MAIIWSIITFCILLIIILSIKGKEILFTKEKIKPKWLRFILLPYFSILLTFMLCIYVFFCDEDLALFYYFLEIDILDKEILTYLKAFSNISSFVFSLSNFYILLALTIFLLVKGHCKYIYIPITYILIYPFTLSLLLRAIGYYRGIYDLDSIVKLDKLMAKKLVYLSDKLHYPILIYISFLLVVFFLFYSNRNKA